MRIWLFSLLVACDCGSGHVASVTETVAHVERDRSSSEGAWEDASVGDDLDFGDGLRTGADSTARLSLESGGALEVRPETLIRFGRSAHDTDAVELELEMGEVLLEGGPEGLTAHSFLGSLVLEGGARVRLRARGDVEVLLGALDLTLEDGSTVVLAAGETFSREALAVEDLAVEDLAIEDDAPEADADALGEDIAEEVDVPLESEAPQAVDRVQAGTSPSRWVFDLASGSSATVHAPTLPARLAIRAGAACENGHLDLGRGRTARRYAVVDGLVPVSLPGGRHTYTLQCPGADAVTGRIRVLRDAGTAPLPRTPPTSRVELDGRRYTVIYQNQLPAFEVRWAGAAGPATLVVDGRPGDTSRDTWRLDGGALDEGAHTLSARAGERRAPETRVVVRFDNVAPKVALRAPENGGFSAGETVSVQGVLLPGWEVRVGGAIERGGRFDIPITVPSDRGGFAVELRHPRRGLHYYLRETR